jgi:AcrR family transcriptional regulator
MAAQVSSLPTDTVDETRTPRRKPESLSKLKIAARKLFVERGYDATRPQDIAREAGLGHGTFYLHYPDKRACFLAFVEDAREELDDHVRERVQGRASLESLIAATLNAIYDYAESHPGVLSAAMTDEAVIDAEGVQAVPLLQRWGADWAHAVQAAAQAGRATSDYDNEVVGQAIVGAIHQAASEGHRSRRGRETVIQNLTHFLAKALRP